MKRVCVYCASSNRCDTVFIDAARELGTCFAREGIGVVYGGGAVGLMGALADGATSAGGDVLGVIPEFMMEREWGHPGITELCVVPDMHQRKQMMIDAADALVALPGGCGTLEELFEAITWKRLGLHDKPIVIANLRGFFDPCVAQLHACVDERFMDPEARDLWTPVDSVAGILQAINGR